MAQATPSGAAGMEVFGSPVVPARTTESVEAFMATPLVQWVSMEPSPILPRRLPRALNLTCDIS